MTLSSRTTPLLTYRAIWDHPDISAFWPMLQQDTYYWVVLSPTTPLSISASSHPSLPAPRFNGAIWMGINSLVSPIPPICETDNTVFTARMLRSQTGPGDAVNASATAAGLRFINSAVSTTAGWTNLPSAASRLKNWQSSGSAIKYGLQVIGFLQAPTTTATMTRECIF